MRLLRRLVLVPVFLCLVFTVLPVLPLMAQTEVISGGGAATSVSAAAFPLLAPDGTQAAPSYSFSSQTGTGMFRNGANDLSFAVNGTRRVGIGTTPALFLPSDSGIFQLGTSTDVSLGRAAAGVWKAGIQGGADHWIQNAAGDQFLTADHTNATATPTDLTALSTPVTSGRKYSCEMTLMQSQSVAADGVRIDFEGGTATATNFRAHVTILDGTAYDTHTAVTALATDVTSTDVGTTVLTKADIAFEPSSTGTFIPRVGLEAASTGTITTARGSTLHCKDEP